MKHLVILGGGTAGTMVANHMIKELPRDWELTLVDPDTTHVYQPGLLFLPFGARDEKKILRPRAKTLHREVRWVNQAVDRIEKETREVVLDDGERLAYDLLVIATGSHIHPEETEGMTDVWHDTVHDFYTLEGAQALRRALAEFDGGRLVLNVVEMPIKCPIAPLEFLFLADEYFQRRGIRDRVELLFATPLDGAFTRPIAAQFLGELLEQKGVRVITDFGAGEVDGEAGILRSYDDREVAFDLLVSIPTHMGAEFLETSGLGDELNFVPTDPQTLAVKGLDGAFAIGDATNLPSSKAGSVAHFQAEVLVENLSRAVRGESLVEGFDGHANCFIESGFGKAVLIDFSYDVEPLPGTYPLPAVGPFSLLKESRINHWGKLAFRWLYWNRMLPGKGVPVSSQMKMSGKRRPKGLLAPAT
jgi:sulfide:quinone oxidoreductase